MYSALEIAKWFLLKNNAEATEHEASNDDYEVYEGITHLKLQKLLYYAQGICLAICNRKLFDDEIEAWQHGPVVRNVYEVFCSFGRNPISISMTKQDEDIINNLEQNREIKEVLDLTYDNFAIYTAWQLRQMTHVDGSPWDVTEKSKGLGQIIDVELIKDYFKREVVE